MISATPSLRQRKSPARKRGSSAVVFLMGIATLNASYLVTESMSSHHWACFSCRRTTRRPATTTSPVTCAICGKDCRHLSPTVKIPPKNRIKDWGNLRDQVDLSQIRQAERRRIEIADRKRWLERRIKELEEEPPGDNRDYLLLKYQQELCASA